ncbi:MAG TPA: hypothetical protein VFQ65_13025 [Kofleriaceae bacterium]|nr:hypothetical protein [Kofleriaceae bacterium]
MLAVMIPLAVALAPMQADAQISVSIGIAPPSAYIATTQPEYFEGRPVYWYNNNWYYRDHGRWSYYRSEPRYLRERRAHWVDRPRYQQRERVERDRGHDRDHDRDRGNREGPTRYRYRR